ncbi:MAG: YdcF family protein [Candidatus Protistobacter heckmanni]|nr:YdcF family protein [Candidatus Protistobacter heckmanni]
MSWLIRNLLAAVIMPPANLILTAALLLLIWGRRRWTRVWAFLLLALLWVSGTSWMGDALMSQLERESPALKLSALQPQGEQAVIVLGGGRNVTAYEVEGGVDLSNEAAGRVRYGARLARQVDLPVLVTGGNPGFPGTAEGVLMGNFMKELGVTPRWVESASANTAENASLSAPMLKAAGVKKIYLVTSASHMPRSKETFERAGFQVTAAPCQFHAGAPLTLLDYLPSPEGFSKTSFSVHECLGLLWYRMHRSGAADGSS